MENLVTYFFKELIVDISIFMPKSLFDLLFNSLLVIVASPWAQEVFVIFVTFLLI